MRPGGRYVTCGLEDQFSQFTGLHRTRSGLDFAHVLLTLILKNLTVLGNCLGRTADLADALTAHRAGRFPAVIDSVHWDDPTAFLAQTYASRERFGKVVFVC